MKRVLLPTLIACAAMVTSCSSNSGAKSTGIDIANMDTTVAPGANFYQYANGGWIKQHPLTAEYARFGSFDLLAEQNREQIKQLIENLAQNVATEKGVGLKIGTLYNVAMDSAKLNKEGAQPIADMMAKIDTVADVKELTALVAEFETQGVGSYFSYYISPDEKNSSVNLFNIVQGGLSLGQKEYYLDTDTHTTEIRNKFAEHVVKMFALCGFDEAAAAKASKSVMAIETQIAKASKSKAELRDPQASYNPMTLAELQKAAPEIDWTLWLKTLGAPQVEKLNVGQPATIKECAKIFATVPLDVQKDYLRWNLIDNASSFMSDAIETQNFEFYGKVLSGKESERPRWKRSVDLVNSVLSEAVGQMYVEKYFPAAAKERMLNLVSNLRTALGQRIDNLPWMSDATKKAAHEKLATIIVKVGYPDKWRDYSSLVIENDSYWANVVRASKFANEYELAKVSKPVDNTEWFMPPQMVNAYYNPTTNEICFPAGILQYPFFDMAADDAFNYGAIGVVIGHEMTHGFDDQGCQYDKVGNLNNWWTVEDTGKFSERTAGLVAQFDNINVLPDLKANGSLTLGENIADNGGIQVSYLAYKNATATQSLPTVDGLTPDQRFFIAYAGVWAGNIRDEAIREMTKSDEHSLGVWRVNGTLPNIDAWYEAFNIQPSDPMFIPVEKRVYIW